MKVIDSNVFIRYLTGDDIRKKESSRRLFERIEAGREVVILMEVTIHEVCYILSASRPYNLTHQDIRDRLYPILQLDGIHLQNKRVYLDALDIFAQREYIDYADALAVSYVRAGSGDGIYSYDKALDKIEGANRIEP